MPKNKRYNSNVLNALIIHALYGNKYKTTEELAIDLDISKRTAVSSCKEIRDSNLYSCDFKGIRKKITPQNNSSDLFLTDEDIDELYKSYFFNKIEDELSKKLVFLLGMHLNPKKKLLIQKDEGDGFRDYYLEVKKVKKCINENKKIDILKYKDRDIVKNSTTRGGKDYDGVTPILFDERQNKIFGKYENKFRYFNLERISEIRVSDDKGDKIPKALKNNFMTDVFGFLPKEFIDEGSAKEYNVVMKMTNFAYSLLIRQFPEIDSSKYFNKSEKPELKAYILKVKTFDPYALARFICGIASEVEINENKTDKIALKKIKEWFTDYVKKGLIEKGFIKEEEKKKESNIN